jgi:flagellar hook protein FlgE
MMKTSLTGITAASRDLSTISNNLANALTTGFKRSTAQFNDIMGASASERPGADVGVGALTIDIRRSQTQGTIDTTDNALDLAISGDGYFAYREPKVEGDPMYVYSRSGKLTIGADGNLMDTSGRALMGLSVSANGTVTGTVPNPIDLKTAAGGNLNNISSLSIDAKGVITITRTDGSQRPVAAVALAHFANPEALKAQTGSVLTESDRSGAADFKRAGVNGMGNIQQGALEGSNVDLTGEMLHMIQAQQAYNGNARALQTNSEMLRSAIENLTR